MRHSKYVLLAGGVMILDVSAFGDGPVVETADNGYRIVGTSYTATLDKTGTLTSLVVSGTEFISGDRKIVQGEERTMRGINAAPFGDWAHPCPLTGNVKVQQNRLRAEGDG